MDDSTLKILQLSSTNSSRPILLVPSFCRNIKKYTAIVESKVNNVSVKAVSSEKDAFAQVLKMDKGGVVPLAPGNTDVQIKVDAADGSSCIYEICVFRPSESDVGLYKIDLNPLVDLIPCFSRNETEYTIHVSQLQSQMDIQIFPLNQNGKCERLDNNSNSLNVGDTQLIYKVTSENGNVSEIYTILIRKEKVMFSPELKQEVGDELKCVCCKALVFQPRKKMNCSHMFCFNCLDYFCKSKNIKEKVIWNCPVCDIGFHENFAPQKFSDDKPEIIVSSLECFCPFSSYGCTEIIPYSLLFQHSQTCANKPKPCSTCKKLLRNSEIESHRLHCVISCETCGKMVPNTNHSQFCLSKINVQPSSLDRPSELEKSFHDQKKIIKNAELSLTEVKNNFASYLNILFSALKKSKETKGKDAVKPDISHLNNSGTILSTSIAKEPSNTELHLNLAKVFYEIYLIHSWFPEPKKLNHHVNYNEWAHESFLGDEVVGLLLQLGVPPSANEATQIKAMESEYHRLKNQGQINEAAEVQGLIAWKISNSVKGTLVQENSRNQFDSYLDVSILKFLDVLKLNPVHPEANELLSAIYLEINKPEEAIKYALISMAVSPISQNARTLYSLGITHPNRISAYSTSELEDSIKEMVKFIENYNLNILNPELTQTMLVDDKFTLYTKSILHLSSTFQYLGKYKEGKSWIEKLLFIVPSYLRQFSKECKMAENMSEIFQNALLLHLELELQLLSPSRIDNADRIMKLGKIVFEDRQTNTAMQMLIKTAQIALRTTKSLNNVELLGFSFFESFVNNNNVANLEDAYQTFQLGLTLETCSSEMMLEKQKWWIDMDETEKQRKIRYEAANKAILLKSNPKESVKEKKPLGKKDIATPASVSKTNQKVKSMAPVEKSIPKQATTKPVAVKSTKTTDNSSKVPASIPKPSSQSKDTKKVVTVATESFSEMKTLPLAPIEKRFKMRFGLAITLVKYLSIVEAKQAIFDIKLSTTEIEVEIASLFQEAIQLNPTFHDAYIEFASYLESHCKNQSEAVKVYCSFPFSEEIPTQDDLYLHTEICRILIKQKQFKNPDLIQSIIAEGKASGIKHISGYINQLDQAGESKALMYVYSQVNKKPIDDPDLVQFFKSKYWI